MKKLFLLTIGVIAAITALCMIGPIISIGLSAAIALVSIHYYIKSTSKGEKILWFVIGLIAVLSAIGNIPGLIGLGALAVIYVLYKKWNKEETNWNIKGTEDDPFTNFETEWSKLTK